MRRPMLPQQRGRKGGKNRAKNLSSVEMSDIARKGGDARAQALTGFQRSEIARVAALARWAKHAKKPNKQPY